MQVHEPQSDTTPDTTTDPTPVPAARHLYDQMRDKWERTVPLRGQKPANPGDPKPDIRPIGPRSRKHEVIERVTLGEGDYGYDTNEPSTHYAYAATLYQTRCVIAYPDGTFTVSTGGWNTPATAKFIQQHTPPWHIGCAKVSNNLWLYGRDSTGSKPPIKHKLALEPTRFYIDRTRDYGALVCTDPKPIKVERVDRSKTRPYHQRLKPFMDWMRTTLAMSDGWLMHETCKEILGVHSYTDTSENGVVTIIPSGRYHNPGRSPAGELVSREVYQWCGGNYGPNTIAAQSAFEWFSDLHEREEDWLFALCLLSLRYQGYDHAGEISRIAETFPRMVNGRNFPVKYYDLRLNFTALKRHVYELIASAPDNIKIVEREASESFLNNVVG